MTTWKTMGDAPKDRAVLLWVTRFATVPAGQSEPAAVVGLRNSVGRWKVEPEYLNPPAHLLHIDQPESTG
jgi:hypothetical protein